MVVPLPAEVEVSALSTVVGEYGPQPVAGLVMPNGQP
jgi:hypothetical protein